MKKNKIICIFLCVLLTVYNFTSCGNEPCEHRYFLNDTEEATCTEDGSKEYKCDNCGDTYRDTVFAKGHTPGEAPTFDSPQICIDCGIVLAPPVDYMPYRANDLAINHYYGYSNSFITTNIDTQNHGRSKPVTIPYVNKIGLPCNLELSIPIQDFFKHSVKSVLPLSTSDGKTYSTDSGFKVDFSINLLNKDVKSINAWNHGLSSEFEGSDLVKVVGEYRATPASYNYIYELVDFSNCYIEIAKETASGYETVKKIDKKEEWNAILQTGVIEISNDNGKLFFDAGTYRVLFKYNMTWVSDPSSAVYSADDAKKENPIYPYGRFNDQYEFFYIEVTNQKSNVLLPDNIEISSRGFLSQLRVTPLTDDRSFIDSHSVLKFQEGKYASFKVGAKVDMSKTGYRYNKEYVIQAFDFTVYVYNGATDTYDEYFACDLMPQISREVVYGAEIPVDVELDSLLRDSKCKITISYTLFNEVTEETITEKQNYYYTFSW